MPAGNLTDGGNGTAPGEKPQVDTDFTLLEHTADVGMRVRGPTLAAVIGRATEGLAEIAGLWRPGRGEEVEVEIEAADPGALLVDWLNEVLYLLEARSAMLCGARVDEAGDGHVAGKVCLRPLEEEEVEGTHVKAATLHGLDVRLRSEGWVATVYLDI
jgi:SHS2 domain-containing protein